MALPTAHSFRPVVLNGTVLPALDINLPQAYGFEAGYSDEKPMPDHILALKADAIVTCRIPLRQALDLVGLDGLAVTALEIYASKFVARVGTNTAAKKWTATKGVAWLRAGTARQGELASAELAIALFEELAQADDGVVPAMPLSTVLCTVGPTKLNTTVFGGVKESKIDFGGDPTFQVTDGLAHPQQAFFAKRSPVITNTYEPALDLLGANGPGLAGRKLDGSYAAQAWYRSYDGATGQMQATGWSITINPGFAHLGPITGSPIVRADLIMRGLTGSGGAHPWTVSAVGQSMPALG